jgi:hypothetical protein
VSKSVATDYYLDTKGQDKARGTKEVLRPVLEPLVLSQKEGQEDLLTN